MKKKPSKASAENGKTEHREPHLMPGFSRGRLSEVLEVLADDKQLGAVNLPARINDELISWATDAARFALRNVFANCDLSHEERSSVYGLMAYAAEAGFSMALYRYAKELRDVPELTAWNRNRKAGGDRGRKTSSQRKEQRYERIRAKAASLERAGEPCTYQDIADALTAEGMKKCGRSTVERAINQRTVKRKKR